MTKIEFETVFLCLHYLNIDRFNRFLGIWIGKEPLKLFLEDAI